jgi:hypothetical protein
MNTSMSFTPTRLTDYSRDALLAEIKRVINGHFAGLCATHKDFNKFSRVHSATVAKVFGSWANAMRSAGFEYSRYPDKCVETLSEPLQITADQLLSELRAIAKKHDGIVFLYDDYKKLGGKRARGTFCKYLGGWRQAVASIGLRDGFSRKRPDLRIYTDEDYFAEIQRLWELLGRQPKARDMRKCGNISHQSFQKRFGSWMKAVYAFCKDRNGPDFYDVIDADSKTERIEIAEPIRQFELQVSIGNLQEKVLTPKRLTPRKPSLRLRFRILKRDNFRCCTCGRSPVTTPGLELHVDHMTAWSLGGETVEENLQTKCESCNLGKSNVL